MNRMLSNTSVKTSLTAVLTVFSLLIITIAALGYQAGKRGDTALQALDYAAMHEMLPLNLSRVNLANAKLYYTNSFYAEQSGDAEMASRYLAQAQQFHVASVEEFSTLLTP
ncbi:Tar ligand binding domain-containing protein [Vreelandella neptunia]|uniref:Tar ligand binding domain-containing protein n=1 Tax=Vreelandella neptunia TaxID=115551 RepID=A0ABS9S606_9GAMM|nr:Tar ligand binding domain-containing protein [Halomonas neptunia]MCH4811520.1 Tar ligand binding domain-containing protein [Halomonas neptunia]